MAALVVVAGAGLVLSFAAPSRPVHDVVDAGQRGQGEGREESADLVGRERDQLAGTGSRAPFSSRAYSVARVVAR